MVLMAVVAEFTSLSGGLICLGKKMCSTKRKNPGRKKSVLWRTRSGLWKGGNGPDDGVINWRPWYNRSVKRNNEFFKPR
mgnify:FL=1